MNLKNNRTIIIVYMLIGNVCNVFEILTNIIPTHVLIQKINRLIDIFFSSPLY